MLKLNDIFILISKTFLAVSLFILAGCQVSNVSNITGLFNKNFSQSGQLAGGILITAPEGYCIDRRYGRRNFSKVGLVFASCVRLEESNDLDHTFAHLLTASNAGAKVEVSVLANFMKSREGLSALAMNNVSDDVLIYNIETSHRVVYVEFSDLGRPEYLGQRGWKAFLIVENSLVILGGYSGVGASVSGVDGEELLREFAQSTLDNL